MKKATNDSFFWKTTPLSRMTQKQWESLCDGCGKCCLVKLRDADTDKVLFTNLACKQLDLRNCQCKDYKNRKSIVHDCVQLSPRNIGRIDWLPETCAYKLIYHGKDLPWWHPLISGDRRTVHQAGISMRHRAISETKGSDPENHIVDWIS